MIYTVKNWLLRFWHRLVEHNAYTLTEGGAFVCQDCETLWTDIPRSFWDTPMNSEWDGD
jgi:fatty-acid desaturase